MFSINLLGLCLSCSPVFLQTSHGGNFLILSTELIKGNFGTKKKFEITLKTPALESLYSDQITLSILLIKLNICSYSRTDTAQLTLFPIKILIVKDNSFTSG